MKTSDILDQVLGHIRLVYEDKQKLQKILDFILEEIYEQPEEEMYEIPEKFEQVLKPIAESIDCGLICFLNPETMQIEEVPKMLFDDPHEYEMVVGGDAAEEEFKHKDWDEYDKFEPLDSHRSFKIMQAFADNMEDVKFQEQLFYALNKRKPFASFKWKIENSAYRQNWFDFKQKKLEEHVRKNFWSELNRIE